VDRRLLQPLLNFDISCEAFSDSASRPRIKSICTPSNIRLLLQVAGAPEGALPSLAYAAGRLGLRHNSAVELVNRSVTKGLLVRIPDPQDHRRVLLEITLKGWRILKNLSQNHARELRELGLLLLRSLRRIERADRAQIRRRTR